MIWQTYLTSQFQLNWWTEDSNTTHQPVTWQDHIRPSFYMPIPGVDARAITPELNQRLKFFCSWTWCFYCGVFFCFVLDFFVFFFYFIIVIFYFTLLLFLFSFFLINSIITIFSSLFLPTSLSLLLLCYDPLFSLPLLFLLLLIYCLPLPSLPHSHQLPTCNHTTYKLTTSWLAYCTPTPTTCNHRHKHPTLQQKYNQTHTRATKPSSPGW
jgi:hypothetical protein